MSHDDYLGLTLPLGYHSEGPAIPGPRDLPPAKQEYDFIRASLSVLAESMTKMTQFFLLQNITEQEMERVNSSQVKVGNTSSINISPASTTFYETPSREFLMFSQKWLFVNYFYSAEYGTDLAQKFPLHRTSMTVQEILNQVLIVRPSISRPKVQFVRTLEARSLEECAFIAEIKVREVFGIYKLIVNEVVKTKLEAAQIMQTCGNFPAQRLLIWADEFYTNNGKFTRY